MHSKVYTHRKAKGLELLVADALHAAEPVLRLVEAKDDVSAFLALDDTTLLRRLQYLEREPGAMEEYPVAVREAQELSRRIARRELYAFVEEVTVPPEFLERNRVRRGGGGGQGNGHASSFRPDPEDVAKFLPSADGSWEQLKPEELVLGETRIDFTRRDANPLDRVQFYGAVFEEGGEGDGNGGGGGGRGARSSSSFGVGRFQISARYVSSLFGSARHCDHKVRLYCKRRFTSAREKRLALNAAKQAFRQWAQATMGSEATPPTPFKMVGGGGGGGRSGGGGGGGRGAAAGGGGRAAGRPPAGPGAVAAARGGGEGEEGGVGGAYVGPKRRRMLDFAPVGGGGGRAAAGGQQQQRPPSAPMDDADGAPMT
jgi:hypothetical protein